MAYSIVVSNYPDYPTSTVIRVNITVKVEAAGTYNTVYNLYKVLDTETEEMTFIESATGSPFSISSGQVGERVTVGYKTFSGLEPNTYYALFVYLIDSNTGTVRAEKERWIKTNESNVTLTVKYYECGSSDTVTTTSSITIRSSSRSGWTFVGWATDTETTSVSSTYAPGKSVSVGSSDSTLRLYAVYKKETTIYCYFIDGSTGNLDNKTVTKVQYCLNTSSTTYSEDYYNNITLPSFTSADSSITTTVPSRTWTAVGWIQGGSAESPDYTPGQNVATNYITGNLYAVYSNECSITYNSNGGSGSMTKQTGTGYYNAFGNYVGATFTVKDCTFTPPSGKRFGSWNQKSDGSGTTYHPGDSVPTNYNNTFYAIWVKARPSNWSWPSHTADKPISSGSSMNYIQSGTIVTPTPLTAAEWLAFMNRIKEFYAYDNGKTVNSTYWNNAVNGVKSGSPMTATQVNSARYLISQLPIQTTLPSAVSSGGRITAAFINGLKNSLNSIP